jgi:hypothetical protein
MCQFFEICTGMPVGVPSGSHSIGVKPVIGRCFSCVNINRATVGLSASLRSVTRQRSMRSRCSSG